MRYALLLLMVGLTGCSATGPAFNEVAFPPGLVVYKPAASIGMAAGLYEVDINGKRRCKLHPGSFFIAEGLEGNVVVSSSVWDMPGTSRINFTTKPGQAQYIRMDANNGKQIAATAGGLAGALLAEGASNMSGPFIFRLIDAAQAKRELQGLKQDCI